MEGGQESEDGIGVLHAQHVEPLLLVGDQVAMRQWHCLGCLLRSAREKHHRGAVRIGSRDTLSHDARQPAHFQQRQQQVDFTDLLPQFFEVDPGSALDLDADAIDEHFRGDDMLQAHDLGGVREVCRAGGPVEDDGQFPGEIQTHQRHIAANRGGKQQTDIFAWQRAEVLGHVQRADQHALVSEYTRLVVGRAHGLALSQGTVDERLRDSRSLNGQLPFILRHMEPVWRRRFRRFATNQPRREGVELAHAGRHLIAAEAETLFDLQAQIHAVEAIHAEVVEGGIGMRFGSGERSVEFLGDHLTDGLARLGREPTQIERFIGLQNRKFMFPRPEQEVGRHERRLLGSFDIVPRFQPGIENLALQARQSSAIDVFQREVHPPAWSKEDQVGENVPDPLRKSLEERRSLAVPGVTESAAPHSARPHQHHLRLRHVAENVRKGPRRPQLLDPRVLDMARGPEDDVLAIAECLLDVLNRLGGALRAS